MPTTTKTGPVRNAGTRRRRDQSRPGNSHPRWSKPRGLDSGYNYDGDGNETATPTTTSTYNALDDTLTSNGDSFSYAGSQQNERTSGDSLALGNGLTGTDSQFDTSGLNGSYFEYLPNGTLISQRVVSVGVQTGENFYVTDANGSVTSTVSSSGSVNATYSYDPYGSLIAGSTTLGGSATANPYGFDGAYYDSAAGLYKMGARYYTPSDGRFTQQDTEQHLGDLNQGDRYSFAGDDPINNVDPSGLCSGISCVGDAFGAVGGALGFSGLAEGVAGVGEALLDAEGGLAIGLGVIGVGLFAGSLVGLGAAAYFSYKLSQ